MSLAMKVRKSWFEPKELVVDNQAGLNLTKLLVDNKSFCKTDFAITAAALSK